MKVFIDAGAYDGDTLKAFFNWGTLIGNPEEYKIYAFEPNTDMHKDLEELAETYPNITLIKKAVWTKNETIQFAVDKTETPLGSTAMSSKTSIWDKFEKVDVEAIDFSEWLKQFENDDVILKMDIEGAEFPVLAKMIKDGTITIPNRLMVEFHPNKVRDYTTTYKDELVAEIKSLGVNLEIWH